jgi:transcriptional regulator with XRE-family HTH domain
MEDWKARLEDKRKERGFSMRKLSQLIGHSPDYIKITLRQKSEPPIATFIKIADALGVSVFWLWYGYPVDREDEKLIRDFARLSEKNKDIIKASLATALEGQDQEPE